ncbi:MULTISPECIES: putative quinol monooxygenase [unclassified Paludibacterium]|uniref:putative quinol monooxygenase n=1 Tax=unclassified Paludibacterium TaxID=2618429 RepID=UPI001C0472A9|nr:putative quinol monooxygenase [Paludibacterium sp. B53371]BEV72599.1 putative quinol monooxygenase [Paludibacterium sp. THUN1379]
MKKLTVVATITAKPGYEQAVEAALLALIEPSRHDEGFIQYDLHRELDKPNVFVFYENWASKDLLDKHLQSPHLADYQRKVDGMIASWDLKLMEQIG